MNNVFLMDYTGVGVDLGFHELHQIGKDIVDTEVITNESLEFIKSPPRQPFFLHINYNTPHGSYSPPEHSIFEIKQNSNSKDLASLNPIVLRYFGEVRFTDEQVGKIIEQLKKRNM
jgi:phosphoglycerol transferase MdoB-like AlkP superfamily enzyme